MDYKTVPSFRWVGRVTDLFNVTGVEAPLCSSWPKGPIICNILRAAIFCSLASCSASDPDCGDKDAQNLAIEQFHHIDDPFNVEGVNDRKIKEIIQAAIANETEFDHNSLWAYLVRTKYEEDIKREHQENTTVAQKAGTSPDPFWYLTYGTYDLYSVRMQHRDDNNKSVVCAAAARLVMPGYGSAARPIRFLIEKTTDGKPFVTLYREW